MAQTGLSSRWVAPVGVLIAVAVAVGVWLAPTGWMDPERRGPGDGPDLGQPAPPPVAVGGHTQQRPDWEDLGEMVAQIRDPVVIAEEPDQPAAQADATQGGEEAPGDQGEPAPQPAPVTLPWEYLGLVDHDERSAALVRVGGIQRFLFEGQEVDEPATGGRPVRIVLVEPQTLHVRVGESEITLERVGRDESATPQPGRRADRRGTWGAR